MRPTPSAQLGCILCWFLLSWVAAAQTLMIALGHYHPVTADSVPPGFMPFYWTYLAALMAASSLGSLAVLWKFGDARKVLIKPLVLCWASQLALWVLSLMVGLTWRYFR